MQHDGTDSSAIDSMYGFPSVEHINVMLYNDKILDYNYFLEDSPRIRSPENCDARHSPALRSQMRFKPHAKQRIDKSLI